MIPDFIKEIAKKYNLKCFDYIKDKSPNMEFSYLAYEKHQEIQLLSCQRIYFNCYLFDKNNTTVNGFSILFQKLFKEFKLIKCIKNLQINLSERKISGGFIL